MNRLIDLPAQLAVIAVPIIGWFGGTWSGATTLVVYWCETVVTCLLVATRIRLHQRWNPRHGHFRYRTPSSNRGGARGSSFAKGFLLISISFCAAHAVFLGAILFLLHRNDAAADFAAVSWRSVGIGGATVLGLLVAGFAVDLRGLRGWTFWRLEQQANQGLSRVVVIHLTLILGFAATAMSGASDALFSVFVVLKTLAALSWAIPQ